MRIISENTNRKIDSLGRIGVPKGLRNRMRFETNQEMEFFTIEDNGKTYVAFAPVEVEGDMTEKYMQAADLLSELGLDIPDEILDHIG